jgi:hypothetical protein
VENAAVRSVDLRVRVGRRGRRQRVARTGLKIRPNRCASIDRSQNFRHRVKAAQRCVRPPWSRSRRSNLFVATIRTKTSTTGVIRVFRREEGSHNGVPDHFADGLDVREATIDPVVVEVPQASHEVGLTPHSTWVKTVTEENPRFCVGRKLPFALRTDRTGEKVDQSPEGDSETFELTSSVAGGPGRGTLVLRDVVGHAEVAGSKGPPFLWEARLLEGDASALDDALDGTLGNPV